MYPITSIIQLTILFGTSCESVNGHDRLDCVPPRQAIALTLGLGVMGRGEILEGMENPQWQMIEGRKSPISERIKARQGVYGKAKGRSRNDFGCIVHNAWVNFTGQNVSASEPC